MTFTWPAIKDGIMALNHALYGKKSEKLADDDRKLAFEERDLVRLPVGRH